MMVPGLAGKGVSFRSVRYPNRYLRHRGGKLYVDVPNGKDIFTRDATFHVRYGLGASQSRFGVSFESFNHPGYFIGHIGSSFRLQVLKKVDTPAFKMSTTWMPVTSQVKMAQQTQSQVVHHTKQVVKQVQSKYMIQGV